MANVKNFGLIGVADNVQYGKAGPKLKHTAGTFQFRNAADAADAGLTAAGITSSAGNVTLTTGNVVLSSNSGVVTLGDAGSISRQATGVFQLSGTGAVIVPTGNTATRPAFTAGSFRYNSETGSMEYGNGSAWVAVATGGAALTAVTVATANGFAGTSSGGTTPELTLTTSVTGLLKGNGTAISAVVSGTDIKTVGGVSLLGSGDVGVIGPQYGGTGVANGVGETITLGGAIVTEGAFNTVGSSSLTLTTTGATNVTLPTTGTLATTAGTVASFSTGTTGLLANSVTTPVTGAVTLTGTLEADNGGTGLSTFTSGSVLYASAANTWSAAVPGATSGVQAYNADLEAIAAYGTGTTGYSIRTGDGTWRLGSIEGTAGNISVTQGAGAANTVINLATAGTAVSNSFVKITTDSFGRVTATSAVATGDLTTLLDATYVNVAGDTMTGALAMGGNLITGLADPVSGTDAANKNYVDAATAGLTWKTAVLAATTANITLSGAQTIDGVSVVAGNRVLVKNQSTAADNGIYVAAAGAWTRSTDADSPAELDGAAVFVQQGTQADTGWTQTATIVTVGTTAQTWVQFTGAGAYVAGVGLDLTGNTFSVNLGAGIAQLPSDEVGIDVETGKAVQLTSTATGGQLTFVLDTGSGMEQSATGLKISAAGVTNTMLANSTVTVTGTTGSDAVALGESLAIIGDSAAITTAMGTNSLAISARLATTSLTGVASFSSDNFDVTAGVVTVKAGGIDLATEVTGVLPGTNGGTGVNNGSNTITLGGNFVTSGANALTLTTTGATNVTLPTSGTLLSTANIAANAVTSFQTSLSGLTPSTATNGVVTLAGTLGAASGGTGVATLGANQVMIGNGTGAVLTSSALSFVTDTLTIGTGTIQGATGGDVTITATATNGDINLIPNGTGSVIIGPSGAGVIASESGQSLTVTGSTTLALTAGTGAVTITSTDGDTVMALSAGDNVTVTGVTPAAYAGTMADADLANKYYVDQVASAGGAGDVKAVKATFSLAATGTFNIGAALPAGATILSVKANVTSADTGTGTLSVGKSGSVAAYMTTGENDTQSTGMYLAETMVTEAGSEQVIGTVAGTPAGAGSVTVVVTYQLA